MTNVDYQLKNLFILINRPPTTRPSFVWNHFGCLYKKPKEPVDTDRFHCKFCFDKVENEQPDVSFLSIRKKISTYIKTSSTGNMKNHLLSVHQVTESHQTKTTNEHILTQCFLKIVIPPKLHKQSNDSVIN